MPKNVSKNVPKNVQKMYTFRAPSKCVIAKMDVLSSIKLRRPGNDNHLKTFDNGMSSEISKKLVCQSKDSVQETEANGRKGNNNYMTLIHCQC